MAGTKVYWCEDRHIQKAACLRLNSSETKAEWDLLQNAHTSYTERERKNSVLFGWCPCSSLPPYWMNVVLQSGSLKERGGRKSPSQSLLHHNWWRMIFWDTRGQAVLSLDTFLLGGSRTPEHLSTQPSINTVKEIFFASFFVFLLLVVRKDATCRLPYRDARYLTSLGWTKLLPQQEGGTASRQGQGEKRSGKKWSLCQLFSMFTCMLRHQMLRQGCL